jgi:hypothetical protein
MSASIARNAATAIGFGDRPPSRRIKLTAWRSLRSGKLYGFASVELLEIGLILIDLPVFSGTNGFWAALPRKAKLNREKSQRRDANGNGEFEPCCEWASRQLADQFSATVVELIQTAHPGALDDGETT